MAKMITGLHHITALASDAQINLEFYNQFLGLRLVKRTINFDAPDVYHLYYGDERGNPGTIMTFFPYPAIRRGRQGKGQLTVTSFSIAQDSIDFWLKRFEEFRIPYQKLVQRFGAELVIAFEDPDGLSLELVANSHDERLGILNGPVPLEASIKGFYGATLCEESIDQTAHLLTERLNYHLIAETPGRFRFGFKDIPTSFIDIQCCPDKLHGLSGSGTVHHIAFATASIDHQREIREVLLSQGFNVTPVLDRQYFHSIYFREPGGVLFEIATIPPGFTVDEDLEQLGQNLKLPPWEEENREEIKRRLPSLKMGR